MRIVSANEYRQWLEAGRVIEQDGRGAKVVIQPDGQFLKIFRPRRRLWMARLLPQASRFATNTQRLAERGFRVPAVNELLWLDRRRAISACLYTPLEGQSLLQVLQNDPLDFQRVLPNFARFIAQLHHAGVYFRSLHLGNVLLLANGEFGLIDVLDVHFYGSPLGPARIKRNLRHLQRYLQRSRINDFPWDELLQAYRVSQ